MQAYTAAQIATARESYEFWMSVGASPIHAAALLGCEDGETSFLWKVPGDHGEAHGVFQWHENRIADIKKHVGIDINATDHLGMLKAAHGEMTQRWPGNIYVVWPELTATTELEAAETVLVQKYERSGSQARDILRRTNLAKYWFDYAANNWTAPTTAEKPVEAVSEPPAILPASTAAAPLLTPAVASVKQTSVTSMTLPKLLYRESPNYSHRTSPIKKVVVHDCQGSYQGSIATFLGKGGDAGPVSAHFVLKEDGSEVTQMVPLAQKAWHCCNFNSESVGVEMAGFAERGFPSSEWQATANIVAWLLNHLKLPPIWAVHGVGSGFCSHFDLGKAGGGHADPTTDANVWKHFAGLVTAAYHAGNFPAWPVK